MWNTQLVINTGHVLIYWKHACRSTQVVRFPFTLLPIHKGFFQEQDPSRQAENEGEAASRVHVRPLFVKRWPATNKAGR